MRKLLVIFGLVAVLAMPVFAEENITRGEIKETLKENRLQLKEAAMQTREEFRTKMAQIKDARKKALAERLSAKMCEINKRRTAKMSGHLERMGQILDKITARNNGSTEVVAAVSAARTAIAEAKAAVSAQAGKACDVVVTGTDEALGRDVRQARLALETGLKDVHNKVVAARKAVAIAIRALGRVLGE